MDKEQQKDNNCECKHQAKFSLAKLWKANGEYECRHCGRAIRYTQKFIIINRVLYYIFFAMVLFRILSSGAKTTKEAIISMALLLTIVVAYFFLSALLSQFGSYEINEEEDDKQQANNVEDNKNLQELSELDQANLSEEQKELQSLYQRYADEAENAGQAGQDGIVQSGEEVNSKDTMIATKGINNRAVAVVSDSATTSVEVCEHEVDKKFRNYIPGMMEFTCAKCGKKISFSETVKKRINIVYLFISLALFVPLFKTELMNFTQFSLLVLAVLIVTTILQVFMLKKLKLYASN